MTSLEVSTIDIPTLFVVTLKDAALPPWMSANMHEYLSKLTRKEVDAGHWALVEKPAEVNTLIKDFLQASGASQAKSNL